MNRMCVTTLATLDQTFKLSSNRLFDTNGPTELGRDPVLMRLLEVVSLCGETRFRPLGAGKNMDASPTENALIDAAMDLGRSRSAATAATVYRIPSKSTKI